MSEMIDRVARALFEEWLTKDDVVREQAQNGPHLPWEQQGELGRGPWLKSARTAINAMREPTDDMWEAGSGFVQSEFAWQAMIDAALTD